MKFKKRAILTTYLSSDVVGGYSLRQDSTQTIKITSRKYDQTVRKLATDARVVGQAGDGVSTERGDEFQAMYLGTVVTIVNPEGQYKMGRGIEIEAESRKSLEAVVKALELDE